MILIVLKLLVHSIECLLHSVSSICDIPYLCHLQTLFIELLLHDDAPLVKVLQLLVLHLHLREQITQLLLKVYV